MAAPAYRAVHPPRDTTHRPAPVEVPRPASRGALLVTKLIAVLLLFGASGLLYHVAASDEFRISEVRVSGAQLVSVAEIQQAAAIDGLNIFWVRQEEVGHRLQAISAIQSARVTTILPNRLEVRIVERAPVAVWQSGDSSFLVDADGRVLRAIDQAVALPTIRDVGTQPVRAGGSVDASALVTTFRLQRLLPGVASLQPKEFEYSPDTGVTVVADTGARVRFGLDDDLDWKVAALVAVRRDLERRGQHVELIDLRFKDRPYVR